MKSNIHMQTLIDEYLAHRRCMGFRFADDKAGVLLRSFARHAERVGHEGPITTHLAVEWAAAVTRTSNPITKARRLGLVAGFCRYRSLFDPATEIPPAGLLGSSHYPRKPPYIYSNDEIRDLLEIARAVRPPHGLRPRTYSTLLGLLACTGIRVSEALALSQEDADLTNGVLRIRETKFKKSRFVPLHPSAVDALRGYAEFRNRRCGITGSDRFFLNEGGRPVTYVQIRQRFAHFRRKLGWVTQRRTKPPRIHDLRHTFAVRRILLWHQAGANIDQRIAALSTYLGHVSVTKTYWYLSGTPELLAVVGTKFERLCDRQAGGEP